MREWWDDNHETVGVTLAAVGLVVGVLAELAGVRYGWGPYGALFAFCAGLLIAFKP